jgi:transposase
MVKRKTYTGEYKAAIVLECIRAKKPLALIAEIHQIHPNLIKNWKSHFLKLAPRIFEDKRRKQE